MSGTLAVPEAPWKQDDILTASSAKELEHFERIRQTFESVDKQKQDHAAAVPQTIAEAMEAFSLGAVPVLEEETPLSNGDNSVTGSIHGRIKGLKQWPGGMVRRHSRTSSKGKGKSVAGKKATGSLAGGESDASLDGDDEDMADGRPDDEEEEVDDDYVVRTDHLATPMEEVE